MKSNHYTKTILVKTLSSPLLNDKEKRLIVKKIHDGSISFEILESLDALISQPSNSFQNCISEYIDTHIKTKSEHDDIYNTIIKTKKEKSIQSENNERTKELDEILSCIEKL